MEVYRLTYKWTSGTTTELVYNKALVWIKMDEAIQAGVLEVSFETIK